MRPRHTLFAAAIAFVLAGGAIRAQETAPPPRPIIDDLSRFTYLQLDQRLTDVSEAMNVGTTARDREQAGEEVLDFVREVSRRAISPEGEKVARNYLKTLHSSWRFRNTVDQLPSEYQEHVGELMTMMNEAVEARTPVPAPTRSPTSDDSGASGSPTAAGTGRSPSSPQYGLLLPGSWSSAGAAAHPAIRYDVEGRQPRYGVIPSSNPGQGMVDTRAPNRQGQMRRSTAVAGLYVSQSRAGTIRVRGSSNSCREYGSREYGASPVG